MIKVSNLQYIYKNSSQKAVSNLSFEIHQGEILGFLGPSGAGKTTTQKILIGLLRDYDGSVIIMNKERKQWGKDYFEKIGVAFEFPNLYQKLTAIENLELMASYYSKDIAKDFINELLDMVDLLPHKNKSIEEYSKGMKMRLNFIRAIMHDPEIIFLDEPTSGLDPVNAKKMKEIIISLKNKGKTIFLTTHNMTVADQLCDRIAFIVDGKIKVIDSPQELKIKHGQKIVRVEYEQNNTSEYEEFQLETIGRNLRFFDIMKTKKIKTIHSQEATLEDVFIKLTGRKLI